MFQHILDKQIAKHVRPPTKKHRGKRLRQSKPVITTAATWMRELSIEKGLPMEITGDAGLLERMDDGSLKPWKSTANSHKYRVKLQEPEAIAAFYRLHERAPGRGMDASMLIKRKALGKMGKKVAMAAAPVLLRCHVPRGRSKLLSLPWLSFKHNVVELDENASVTFGVKDYPPWMKKRLRAEILNSYIKMGQSGMDVDSELYEKVRDRLKDRLLCGNHAREAPVLPPRALKTSSTRRTSRQQGSVINDESIESIVAEELPCKRNWHRYLVRWSGYDPSWEAWRLPGRGNLGDPVESWEPAIKLRGTQALADWEARMRPT